MLARGRDACGAQDAPEQAGKDRELRIQTVTGSIPAAEAGLSLPHEHLFSRFGMEPRLHHDYELGQLRANLVPYLRYLHGLGCRTLFDCTTAYFGRDVRLLRELSAASGVRVVANTGYYGAADDRYVPAHAFSESADQLAARWLAEWRDGIDDTGIRPGFVKTGVDKGPLSEIDRKLLTAAARTHRVSGLTIACHTGDNSEAAFEQLTILKSEGVSPSAWVWVHAHSVKDREALARAAAEGAWIELDGLSPESFDTHLARVLELRELGFLGRTLLSHDGNGHPATGRVPRPFDLLLTTLRYALEAKGLSRDELARLLVANPRDAFAVRVRSL